MHAWRFAVTTYLAEAMKRRAIGPELFGQELGTMLEEEYERVWHIYISSIMSKAHFVEYVGRYIRRPQVAEHRLTRVTARNRFNMLPRIRETTGG
jgi:Putative transposase